MADHYNEGAHVVSMDDEDVGVVFRVDEDVLLVHVPDSERELRVPYNVIDEAASTPDRVVIQGALGELGPHSDKDARVTEPGDTQTLRLVGEEAIAHVHEVDRGRLVIDKRVEMVPHEAKVDVGTDKIDIDRVPINEEVDTPPSTRQEGDTLIVPVIEEVLVVTKRYRVVEEVRVRKHRDVETRTFNEELKREVVDVREIDEEGDVVDR